MINIKIASGHPFTNYCINFTTSTFWRLRLRTFSSFLTSSRKLARLHRLNLRLAGEFRFTEYYLGFNLWAHHYGFF
jgi:hypothetical protein